MTKLLLEAERTGYTPDQVGKTMTVGELIGRLQDYDDDTPVYFSNDNGYTYGALDWQTLREYEEEDEDPEEY